MLKTNNPTTIAPPAGMYSHSVEIPPNARMLFTAGQIGVRPDGLRTKMACKPNQLGSIVTAPRETLNEGKVSIHPTT